MEKKTTKKTVTKKTATKAADKKAMTENREPDAVETAKDAKLLATATTAAKSVKAAVAKPAAEKKTRARKTADKKAVTDAKICVQFSGREYSTDALVQIAKDVWEFDLGQDPADFHSVELYVKPEEGQTYYVINGETKGSFWI